MSESEAIYTAIEKLADLLLPDRINWRDVKAHMTGYSKKKAIEQVVEGARKDPTLTKVRLFIIYTELKTLQDNGGIL